MTTQTKHTTSISHNEEELHFLYGSTYIWLADTMVDIHTDLLTGESVPPTTSANKPYFTCEDFFEE